MTRIFLLALLASAGAFAQYQTQNVILVTTDGLRWQDVFHGMDPQLENLKEAGMTGDGAEVRRRFDGKTPEERRKKLMPFLWSTVVNEGVLIGDRDHGSVARVRNRHRFSYPGYSEIMTGRPQDDVINSNDLKPNPSTTVLEIVRSKLDLPREKVALFGSWNVFQGIGAHRSDSVMINAGYQPLAAGSWSPRLAEVAASQFELLTPWRSVRHDYSTFEMAREYFRTIKPRVLYIALGETDDWAHDKRYDRVLETANYVDHCLSEIWQAVQADPAYRGKTTLLVTVDHGRGATPQDWQSHGAKVDGAEYIWMAALGPDTKAQGVAKPREARTQSDIAPTILELLGLDYRLLTAVEGKPLPEATSK
ncbi:MAG: hypothetical protein R2748_28845 [Bryobacterales bacterium]